MAVKPEEKKLRKLLKKLKVEHTRDKDFKELYVTGAMGGFDSQGAFHMIFYSPAVKPDTLNKKPDEQVIEIKHTVKVIMTPATLKQLQLWINKNMTELEKKIGPLKAKYSEEAGMSAPESMYG